MSNAPLEELLELDQWLSATRAGVRPSPSTTRSRMMLLAGGAVADCTAVVLEILDLLLRTNNRHAEILPLVDHMFDTYCETNLPVNVLQGWAYAHGRASEGKLTAGDVEKFRQFQRILPVHPSAWFYSLLDPLWRP